LPDYVVYYEKNLSTIKLVIWSDKNGIKYDGRIIFYLANTLYLENIEPFNLEKFKADNPAYSVGAIERNEKRENLLNSGRLDHLIVDIENYLKAKSRLSVLLDDMPDAWKIREVFDLDRNIY